MADIRPGQSVKFDPPIIAMGFSDTRPKRVPGLTFEHGILLCMRGTMMEMQGSVEGRIYRFCVFPHLSRNKIIPA